MLDFLYFLLAMMSAGKLENENIGGKDDSTVEESVGVRILKFLLNV